ncbi:MAG: hypothetical protein Q4E75_00680 [bacterium]|nr:hypothetical protein [bacterium]
MLVNVFNFWINIISRCFSWIFDLKINENPDISLGMFLLGFFTLALILYFLLNFSDFSFGGSSKKGDE